MTSNLRIWHIDKWNSFSTNYNKSVNIKNQSFSDFVFADYREQFPAYLQVLALWSFVIHCCIIVLEITNIFAFFFNSSQPLWEINVMLEAQVPKMYIREIREF